MRRDGAVLAAHSWYVNQFRREDILFHDFTIDDGRRGTIFRRPVVAPHYERIVVPRR